MPPKKKSDQRPLKPMLFLLSKELKKSPLVFIKKIKIKKDSIEASALKDLIFPVDRNKESPSQGQSFAILKFCYWMRLLLLWMQIMNKKCKTL